MHAKVSSETLKERDNLKDLGVDVQRKIILKLTGIGLCFIACRCYKCYKWSSTDTHQNNGCDTVCK
jgi:hypothetical protein